MTTNERPTSLRIQRLAAGLRIVDIAAKTGLASTRISQIEREEGAPAQEDELALIEHALKGERRRAH